MNENLVTESIALGGMAARDQEAQRIRHSREKLVRDLKTVASDARILAHDAVTSSSARFASARQRLREGMHGARGNLETARVVLRDKGQRATVSTGAYLQRNPWRSIGVLAAAGLVIGLMLGRSTSSGSAAEGEQ